MTRNRNVLPTNVQHAYNVDNKILFTNYLYTLSDIDLQIVPFILKDETLLYSVGKSSKLINFIFSKTVCLSSNTTSDKYLVSLTKLFVIKFNKLLLVKAN
jgi:hypothetical protein